MHPRTEERFAVCFIQDRKGGAVGNLLFIKKIVIDLQHVAIICFAQKDKGVTNYRTYYYTRKNEMHRSPHFWIQYSFLINRLHVHVHRRCKSSFTVNNSSLIYPCLPLFCAPPSKTQKYVFAPGGGVFSYHKKILPKNPLSVVLLKTAFIFKCL